MSNLLACPKCGSTKHLGQNVTGWRGVTVAAIHDGKLDIKLDDRQVYDVEHDAFWCSHEAAGCDPGATFVPSQMTQLGDDGKPIPAATEGQEALDV